MSVKPLEGQLALVTGASKGIGAATAKTLAAAGAEVVITARNAKALLATLDPMLKRSKNARVLGLTSSVGANPRAYWGAYGSTKSAFDNLIDSYAQEVANIGKITVANIDPGATRTDMRAKAFPGEDPKTLKDPQVVADRLLELLIDGFETRHSERIS